MKYNVCGFDQRKLCCLIEKHKEDKQQLDCTDLVILQWIAEFSVRNSVTKVIIDGNQYAWVVYNTIVEDFPFIHISKRAFADRFDKLQSYGLIEKRVEKRSGMGTFVYVRVSPLYEELLYENQWAVREENECDGGDAAQGTTGVLFEAQRDAVQTATKDYITKQDILKQKEDEGLSSNALIPYDEIREKWNTICVSLNKIESITAGRKDKIRLRWKEFSTVGEPMTVLEILLNKLQSSDFITKDSRETWRKKCFDWLFSNSENWMKVYEGNYDNPSDRHYGINERPSVKYDNHGNPIKERQWE